MMRQVLLLMSGMALAAATLAQNRETPNRYDSVPLVRAEPGAVKVKPDDPGGLKVPHADKTIYERIETRRAPRNKKEQESAGKYRIQLGPFDDMQAAQRRWQGLQREHAHLLERLQSRIEKAETKPGRKTFYRLQFGPVDNPQSGRKICAALSDRKVSCSLVKG
jgi:hypothetical protein